MKLQECLVSMVLSGVLGLLILYSYPPVFVFLEKCLLLLCFQVFLVLTINHAAKETGCARFCVFVVLLNVQLGTEKLKEEE
jgi:hypothetical protein